MNTTSFIPQSIAEALELAKIYAASSIVSDQEREDAATRSSALAVSLADAIVSDMFVRILAGAARGLDPSTSLAYFSIIKGTLRATREAPLALCRAHLEEMDERSFTLSRLQDLEFISSGFRDDDAREAAEREVLRHNWRAQDPANTEGKLYAIQVAAAEHLRRLEREGRTEPAGFRASLCAVKRRGENRWHVRIFDLGEAEARGWMNPDNEWWTKFTDDAMRYQARQPLLRLAFADVIGNLPTEDDARGLATITPRTEPPPAEPGVQSGVLAV